MPRGRPVRSAKQMVLAKTREREAVALRKAGASYDAIAERMGISREGARGAVQRGLDSLEKVCKEAAEELRRLDLDRLDAMLLGLWSRAQRGDEKAIDRVLKIMERRSALLGLDAPAKTDTRMEVYDADGARERVARILDDMAIRLGAEPMAREPPTE